MFVIMSVHVFVLPLRVAMSVKVLKEITQTTCFVPCGLLSTRSTHTNGPTPHLVAHRPIVLLNKLFTVQTKVAVPFVILSFEPLDPRTQPRGEDGVVTRCQPNVVLLKDGSQGLEVIFKPSTHGCWRLFEQYGVSTPVVDSPS